MYFIRDNLGLRNIDGIYLIVDIENKYYIDRKHIQRVNLIGSILFKFMIELKSFSIESLYQKLVPYIKNFNVHMEDKIKDDIKKFINSLEKLNYVYSTERKSKNLATKKEINIEVNDTNWEDLNDYWYKRRHPIDGGMELTPNCNMRCVHCYMKETMEEKCLETEQIKLIIDKVVAKGVLFLFFTGGEILTRKDFTEIYIYAKKKGLIIDLLTNGVLINEELVKIFDKYPPARVSISVYGDNPESYNLVTSTRNNFDKLIKNIALLKKYNIHTELKYIGMKENAGEMENIKKIAEKYSADFLSAFQLFPTLKCDTSIYNHRIENSEIVRIEKQNPERVKMWSSNVNRKNSYIDRENVPLFKCEIGTTSFLIDYRGFLNPCNKARIEEYNLLYDDFTVAWNDYAKFKKIPASKNEPCRKCDYFSICSPCPMVNFMSTGNYSIPPQVYCDLAKKRVEEFSKSEYDIYRENL